MADLKKFAGLKRSIEEARRDKDRAEGAFDQLMTRLRDEFDCETLEQAESLLKKKKSLLEKLKEQFDKDLVIFEEEWNEQVEELPPQDE